MAPIACCGAVKVVLVESPQRIAAAILSMTINRTGNLFECVKLDDVAAAAIASAFRSTISLSNESNTCIHSFMLVGECIVTFSSTTLSSWSPFDRQRDSAISCNRRKLIFCSASIHIVPPPFVVIVS